MPTFLTFALCCCHILFISLTGARAGAGVWAGIANWPQSFRASIVIISNPISDYIATLTSSLIIIGTTVEQGWSYIMAIFLFCYHCYVEVNFFWV